MNERSCADRDSDSARPDLILRLTGERPPHPIAARPDTTGRTGKDLNLREDCRFRVHRASTLGSPAGPRSFQVVPTACHTAATASIRRLIGPNEHLDELQTYRPGEVVELRRPHMQGYTLAVIAE